MFQFPELGRLHLLYRVNIFAFIVIGRSGPTSNDRLKIQLLRIHLIVVLLLSLPFLPSLLSFLDVSEFDQNSPSFEPACLVNGNGRKQSTYWRTRWNVARLMIFSAPLVSSYISIDFSFTWFLPTFLRCLRLSAPRSDELLFKSLFGSSFRLESSRLVTQKGTSSAFTFGLQLEWLRSGNALFRHRTQNEGGGREKKERHWNRVQPKPKQSRAEGSNRFAINRTVRLFKASRMYDFEIKAKIIITGRYFAMTKHFVPLFRFFCFRFALGSSAKSKPNKRFHHPPWIRFGTFQINRTTKAPSFLWPALASIGMGRRRRHRRRLRLSFFFLSFDRLCLRLSFNWLIVCLSILDRKWLTLDRNKPFLSLRLPHFCRFLCERRRFRLIPSLLDFSTHTHTLSFSISGFQSVFRRRTNVFFPFFVFVVVFLLFFCFFLFLVRIHTQVHPFNRCITRISIRSLTHPSFSFTFSRVLLNWIFFMLWSCPNFISIQNFIHRMFTMQILFYHLHFHV